MAEIDGAGEVLDREEDNELRLLTWFKLVGNISESSMRRIAQLRSRDRRKDVRDPRPDPANVPPPLHPSRFGIRTPTNVSEKPESRAAS
jgi:hypothetical protein